MKNNSNTQKSVMVEKKCTYFCPAKHGNRINFWALFTLIALVFYIVEIIQKQSLISTSRGLIALILCLLMYLCCLFDGVYITNKQLYYRKYCVKHRIKISEINALFVLDSVSLRRFGSVVYQIDKITGEQLKSVVLVKSIDNDMLNRYYNCRSFNTCFPWITLPYFIYDEEFIKKLKNLNPSIRIINKTMRDLKTSSSETDKNNN